MVTTLSDYRIFGFINGNNSSPPPKKKLAGHHVPTVSKPQLAIWPASPDKTRQRLLISRALQIDMRISKLLMDHEWPI